MNRSYNWQPAYHAVLLERNHKTLLNRTTIAEGAIRDRLEGSLRDRDPIGIREWQQLQRALNFLHRLRRHPT